MSLMNNVIRSEVFKELSSEDSKKFFNINSKKFISHIDTLYYNVYLDEENELIEEFINLLKITKDELDKHDDSIWLSYSKELLYTRKRFSIYDHCISKQGYYDIFIASKLPNDKTPRVVIQLRSIGLWCLGEYQLLNESYRALEFLLKDFDIKILRAMENRIDYCYHTNSIISPYRFFCDDNLLNHLKTSFKIYSKVGAIEERSITIDYLSLGQRKSNNVFFRSYNKVREVIEENYKHFFLEYWFNTGLISLYDFQVYSYAYIYKRYDSIYRGMLDWYINYGSDKEKKDLFVKVLNDPNVNLDTIRKLARATLPEPTLIMNIEFQTMRKFYYYGDKLIDTLPIVTELDIPQLLRVYQIMDNRKIFLDYLTSSTVAFVKDKFAKEIEYLDFWKRLRSCKFDKHVILDYEREYPKNINVKLVVSRIKSSLATLSLYKDNYDTDLTDDMSLLIGILNDNDIKIMEDGTYKIEDDEYIRIKEKRKKALKSILGMNSSRPSTN